MKKAKYVSVIFMAGFIVSMLTGCKKDLTEYVKQKEMRVAVGTDINLDDLFECEEGIQLGFKNADSFNSGKVGSYSLDVTISDDQDQAEKSYIVEVYDDIAPEINAGDIIFYENQEYDLLKDVIVADNSGEEIEATVIEQNIDNKTAGEYSVKYHAKDSSGNEAEKQITVTVKHKRTYSEMKKLAKKIVKEKSLNKLEVKAESDQGVVWVQPKGVFDLVEKGKVTDKDYCAYTVRPGWALMIEDNEISYSILAEAMFLDKGDYYTPKQLYIKSDTGKIESDDNTYNLGYKSGYVASYFSVLQFLFTDQEKIDKSIDIFQGDNLQFKVYTNDKHTFVYKTGKKNKKVVSQLIEFYNELKSR